MDMLTLDPKETSPAVIHSYLLGAVTPRPIAFASTIDDRGNVNLSPFSFFNCFGANPPLLIFSPARRARDNTTKHTYENVRLVPEVVINVVTHAMVQQSSLASTEFPKGVNEFVKAGFTEVPSQKVRPPRVGESPVSMECRVLQIISSGEQPGAGNLVICEVILMHVRKDVLDEKGKIDPFKLDVVARLGGDYYARIQGESIFTVPKPLQKQAIGIDQLPEEIRNSNILTGNDLGLLASVETLPTPDDADNAHQHLDLASRHRIARALIAEGKMAEAWQVLLRPVGK